MNAMKKTIIFLLALLPVVAIGQDKGISGKVIASDDGTPLAGAALIASGGGNYAITDSDGTFSMTVSPEDTVTVSYLGYDDYRFTAGNASTFRIVLQKSAATMLDETVVIGYGKTTKKK